MKTAEYVDDTGWLIMCPGCNCGHKFIKGRWSFNGDFEKPTFSPSMLIYYNAPDDPHYNPHAKSSVCHSFVEEGKIRFLSDCTHILKNQTVDLPDICQV